WDLDTGSLLTVLRPPQGEGDEGKLYAAAMSPDGDLVAVAGSTGFEWDGSHSIYLFERDGKLARRIAGFPSIIEQLRFSRDGRWLAATMGASGVRVVEPTTGRVLGTDSAYDDVSMSADFRADGRRLVTSSRDGHVRLYAVDEGHLRLLLKKGRLSGRRP